MNLKVDNELLESMFAVGIVLTALLFIIGTLFDNVSMDAYFIGMVIAATNVLIGAAVLKYIVIDD